MKPYKVKGQAEMWSSDLPLGKLRKHFESSERWRGKREIRKEVEELNVVDMTLIPQFVHYMPDELEPGILYISKEFELAIHLCACGCGSQAVTPFGSGPHAWKLIGEDKITLHPSILNRGCNAHYWVKDNEIVWC